MPRYTLTARTFINGSLGEPGEIVEYSGWPGSTLEPADEVAGRIKAAYDDMRKRGRNIPKKPDIEKFQAKVEKAAVPEPAPQKDDTDE